MIAMAEAEMEKLRKEGGGRAAAVEAEGRAEAAKIEAIGLAQAKAIEAQGVAEATAILRKAEAWKQFNDAARLQTILEKLPAIIQASTGVFGAVAAPLGNIDKLVVLDQGNQRQRREQPGTPGEDEPRDRVQLPPAARGARHQRADHAPATRGQHHRGQHRRGQHRRGGSGTAASRRRPAARRATAARIVPPARAAYQYGGQTPVQYRGQTPVVGLLTSGRGPVPVQYRGQTPVVGLPTPQPAEHQELSPGRPVLPCDARYKVAHRSTLRGPREGQL